ncbi:hypothetical protein M405DRAFT_819507 [Rhizopogon salebrosus TDB-379]|nr:hypothetical protein M405DRAFT_819507 [Rhizopogon salebrosus TDB-379]
MSSSVSYSPSQVHGNQSAPSSLLITLDVTNSASMQQPAVSASSASESSEARATSSLDSAISSIASTLSYALHPTHIYCLEIPWYSHHDVCIPHSHASHTCAHLLRHIHTPSPHMVRANSHSSQGPIIPNSAKRFAQNAHLHEVKGSLSRRESQRERENDSGDVFSVTPIKKQHHSRHPSSPRRPLFPLDLTRRPQDVTLRTLMHGLIRCRKRFGMFRIYCV